MTQSAKQRKRDAVGNLRELAEELGVSGTSRKKPDMPEEEFVTLHHDVVMQAHTPHQRDRATDALQCFKGQVGLLPALPVLAGMAAPPPEPQVVEPVAEAFRLRSGSCLFTWNSTAFADVPQQDVWQSFLVFVRSLRFVCADSAECRVSRSEGL